MDDLKAKMEEKNKAAVEMLCKTFSKASQPHTWVYVVPPDLYSTRESVMQLYNTIHHSLSQSLDSGVIVMFKVSTLDQNADMKVVIGKNKSIPESL